MCLIWHICVIFKWCLRKKYKMVAGFEKMNYSHNATGWSVK